jgi:pyridoxine 4-dehydrogenase
MAGECEMQELDAGRSGRFRIGGNIPVNRLGFGAMRLTGTGIWGEPGDRAECLRTLRRLPDLGINFIDTADSYGPDVSEHLIREALHPYGELLVATKAGLVRTGPEQWHPVGRPEYLRQQALMSLRFLGVDQIGLWQLHRIDPKVPRDEQFGVMAEMQKEGLVEHLGLSEVNVEEIEAGSKRFRVATVQNEYNLVQRQSEATLDHCARKGIGFIPWFPLAAGALAQPGGRARRDRKEAARDAVPGRARLGAPAKPRDAADSRDEPRVAPRGECRRRRDPPERRGLPGARREGTRGVGEAGARGNIVELLSHATPRPEQLRRGVAS